MKSDLTSFLPVYTKYKDSALPWLGKIPAHWDVRRNGRLFAERKEIGFPNLPILEVSLRTGVQVREFENSKRKQVMSDTEKYKRAARGDIAYNMMRMWQGAVGAAPVDGLVSPAYVVARPYPGVDTRFFAYLFRTDAYMSEVNKYSHGIVSDRNRLYWDEFKRMPSVFPPAHEQKAIADFLDEHTRQVSRYIRSELRLIELLNEQKQAIIHQAMTRGLNLATHRKPSGIEWLGDVPEHWDILKLKFITKLVVGGATPPTDRGDCWDGDIVWVTPEDVSKVDVLIGSARRITQTGLASCSAMLVPIGSLIVTSRAPVGNVSLAKVELCTNQGCKAVVPLSDRLDSDYAYFMFRVLQPELRSLAKGTTFTEISTFVLANVKTPVPPLEEQKRIVEVIGSQIYPIDEAARIVFREIDFIREYRTRLIADVVTGKVDVRHLTVPATDGSGEELEQLVEEVEDLPIDVEGAEVAADADN